MTFNGIVNLMKIETITLCSSASMYEKLIQIEKDLLKLGFKVLVPKSARKMEEVGDFSMKGEKAWLKDPSQFYKKTELMEAHFKKVEEGDAILVVNLDKGGIKGYIGGNVLMEMMLAYYLKKPIYVWKKVEREHPLYEEILGINVKFLDEDLKKLV
jgi:hypothetical protein